jgi:hypothetical protein
MMKHPGRPEVIAILMAPQTIPSRFSLPEEPEPPVRSSPREPGLAALFAATTQRWSRIVGPSAGDRPRASSAAAW